jgi:hypothetical protein
LSAAAFEIASKSGSVRAAVSLGDDEVGQYPPDRIGSRPSEEALGAIVPMGHDAVGIHDDYCIKGGFQYQPEPVARWRQVGKIAFRICSR